MIGVTFQIAASSSGANSGVGFAIPINIVQRVVPALIKSGSYQHAYLGIRGQTYSPAWANELNLPANARGAYIIDVVSGGPSDRAGLRGATAGDTQIVLGVDQSGVAYLPGGGDLVTAVDGQSVKQFDDLLVYLESNKSPGDTITLTVLRPGGRQAQLTITLGARPTAAQWKLATEVTEGPQRLRGNGEFLFRQAPPGPRYPPRQTLASSRLQG